MNFEGKTKRKSVKKTRNLDFIIFALYISESTNPRKIIFNRL